MSVIRNCILALALAVSAAHAGAAEPKRTQLAIGKIVAVVNEDVITRHELDKRIAVAVSNLRKQGTPLPDRAILEKQILENMIMQMLLAQTAKENGIRVSDDQLDSQLLSIAEKNNIKSLEQYRARLEKGGVDFQAFREEMRAQMAVGFLREREVNRKLLVSDSEVDNFLAAEANQPGRGMAYHLAHITVTIPDQASAEMVQASQRRASEALAQLKRGANFAQVAAGYSSAQDALRGGDLGWRPWDQLPVAYREVLSKMRPGDTSPLLHSPNAYHILKLIDQRKQNDRVIVTQTHVRHILVKTSDLVPDQEARRRILEIKKRIENGSSFAEEARLHSDDGSASQGGDLGWNYPGRMVPEFEQAMNSLQPGELSAPVQTVFGWHLIQVLGRRNTDVSDEQKHQRARMAIMRMKSDDAWQDWLRQLRDNAHIEYRLDKP